MVGFDDIIWLNWWLCGVLNLFLISVLQVCHHQSLLYCLLHDLLLTLWRSCFLAHSSLLLDCSICPDNEAPNHAHDQVQIYSFQHWETGKAHQYENEALNNLFLLFLVLVDVESCTIHSIENYENSWARIQRETPLPERERQNLSNSRVARFLLPGALIWESNHVLSSLREIIGGAKTMWLVI